MFAAFHKGLAHLCAFFPFGGVQHGIAGPGGVHLCKQAHRTALGNAEIVGCPVRIVGSIGQHRDRIFEFVLDEGVNLGRIGLHEGGRVLLRIGRGGDQGNIFPPAHKLEIEEGAERACFRHIHSGEILLRGGETVHRHGKAFDEIVGVVNSGIKRLPGVLHLVFR